MKSALGIVITYISVCILGTFAVAVLNMFYNACLSSVVGMPSAFFSFTAFIQGVICYFPIALIFSPMFLSLHRIRFPKYRLLPITFYVILCVITWYLFLPLVFSKIPPFLIVKDSTFSDPVIEKAMAMPFVLKWIISIIQTLKLTSIDKIQDGYLSWAMFASVGFSLSSVFGLAKASEWKLVNSFLIIFSTLGLLVLNCFYWSTDFFDSIENNYYSFFPVPLIVFFNLFCFAFLLITGIRISIQRHRQEEE